MKRIQEEEYQHYLSFNLIFATKFLTSMPVCKNKKLSYRKNFEDIFIRLAQLTNVTDKRTDRPRAGIYRAYA